MLYVHCMMNVQHIKNMFLRRKGPVFWGPEYRDPKAKMRALILCLWHLVMVRENHGKEYFTVFRNTVDKEDFDTIGGAMLNETGTGYITALTICLRQVKISFCKSVPEQNYWAVCILTDLSLKCLAGWVCNSEDHCSRLAIGKWLNVLKYLPAVVGI